MSGEIDLSSIKALERTASVAAAASDNAHNPVKSIASHILNFSSRANTHTHNFDNNSETDTAQSRHLCQTQQIHLGGLYTYVCSLSLSGVVNRIKDCAEQIALIFAKPRTFYMHACPPMIEVVEQSLRRFVNFISKVQS